MQIAVIHVHHGVAKAIDHQYINTVIIDFDTMKEEYEDLGSSLNRYNCNHCHQELYEYEWNIGTLAVGLDVSSETRMATGLQDDLFYCCYCLQPSKLKDIK
ncbi:hypothetical protein PaeCFBP13512_18740 [Paenibacillus sp. CFBP13512]|uniref:hypothetical protein n=1 Tax=Paenibacillus sp. CFBP13512 TaxID=2184007 RepID=UPI0010C06AB6|nr:hypothetical protein [Paenibacillus sp. CFBP13512]TKJ87260.1 hypothetical protein PaeCFBP13512_18740 [Paenibacillus sp. CFBP13512]